MGVTGHAERRVVKAAREHSDDHAGAGGIGFLVNQSIKLFRFDEMATHLLVVMVLVVAVDQLSAFVRRSIGA